MNISLLAGMLAGTTVAVVIVFALLKSGLLIKFFEWIDK